MRIYPITPTSMTQTILPRVQPMPQPTPAPRLSLSRVLWYKILKWIEQSTSSAIMKATIKLFMAFMLGILVFAPNFALGYLMAALQWNSYRIPTFFAVLALAFNARRMYLYARRRVRAARAGGNQHTYHGIPVPEIVDFLIDRKAFKRDEAIKTFALSQGQYAKIAQEMEERGVLIRGEANARILREISRTNLARQLRDGFPLVYDQNRDLWVERNGDFDNWVLRREFTQRKLMDEYERKERKLERLEDRIEEAKETAELLESPLTQVFAHSA